MHRGQSGHLAVVLGEALGAAVATVARATGHELAADLDAVGARARAGGAGPAPPVAVVARTTGHELAADLDAIGAAVKLGAAAPRPPPPAAQNALGPADELGP